MICESVHTSPAGSSFSLTGSPLGALKQKEGPQGLHRFFAHVSKDIKILAAESMSIIHFVEYIFSYIFSWFWKGVWEDLWEHQRDQKGSTGIKVDENK